MLAGVSDTLLRRLQSVLNAAPRLVFSARRSEHITPLLCELHWLRVPERIKFRLCVLAFRCLHCTAPRYLAETLHLTTSRSSCRRLRSAATSTLIVPATRRRTLGDRAFPIRKIYHRRLKGGIQPPHHTHEKKHKTYIKTKNLKIAWAAPAGWRGGGAAAPCALAIAPQLPLQMKFENCGVPIRQRRRTCQIRLLTEVYTI